MAKTVQTSGVFTVSGSPIAEYSIAAASGTLGSVIHGVRIEIHFHGEAGVALSMGAADALQLAEEIRAAVHRRDDVRHKEPLQEL